MPRGRPTLVCGGPGSGKTLLAVSFLVNGAEQFGEPGVFMTFEENAEDIAKDVASLGFDLQTLVADGKLAIDYVYIERSEIEETGEYDLEGLFVRLDHAIRSIGAKRVVLDTIESLFSGLSNTGILRAELRRLFRWLKDKGVTTIVTAERGDGTLTRNGLEEYVSDAVIMLDHRVDDQISTRRLRVVKYRGSHHGTNEYPFLIDRDGIAVLPITSLGLDHPAPTDRVSTGVEILDSLLGDRGFYRGSTILVSGTAGTGKTSFAAHFLDAGCRRGERCLHMLMEESPQQVVRNMRSIGLDLQPWIDKRPAQLPRRPTGAARSRTASGGPSSHGAADAALARRDRSRHEPAGHRLSERSPGDAHANHRSPEDRRHHGAVHQLDPGKERDAGHRYHDLVADGHVGPDDAHRTRQAAAARDRRAQVPRDGAFERDSWILTDRSRLCVARRAHGRRVAGA